MPRVLPLLALLLAASPGLARAKYCGNPCQVADGVLCASLYADRGGVLIEHVLERAQPVRVRVGRQSGTCGGLQPLPAAELQALQILAAPQARGPFAAVKAEVDGDVLRFTPDVSGPLFLRVQPRAGDSGKAAALLAVVVPAAAPAAAALAATTAGRPEVRLQLRLPRGVSTARSLVTLRYLPPAPAEAEAAGFPRGRWPTFRQNAAPGQSERPLRLPLGDYEVQWSHRDARGLREAVVPIQVRGPGPIPVVIPAAPVR